MSGLDPHMIIKLKDERNRGSVGNADDIYVLMFNVGWYILVS